ncbi:hypothetical protein GCM10028819_09700 [Spirosoma humi]
METLLLPDFTIKRPVSVASIEYLEAMSNYSLVHLRNQRPMLVAITLKRLSERLPSFLRIHKGTLVNPDYIEAYQLSKMNAPFVQLSRNRKLSVSRRQLRQIKPRLTNSLLLVPAPVR